MKDRPRDSRRPTSATKHLVPIPFHKAIDLAEGSHVAGDPIVGVMAAEDLVEPKDLVFEGPLRREVHKGTTKVERSHQFVKYLNFGGEGGMKTNNPTDQEKAIVYNELVANAVALQTVADQTQALHALRRRGIEIPSEDL